MVMMMTVRFITTYPVPLNISLSAFRLGMGIPYIKIEV